MRTLLLQVDNILTISWRKYRGILLLKLKRGETEMDIGKRIRYYRQQRGLTQRDFAKKLCISTQAVSKWENGHTFPDLPTFIRIAELLYVSLDNLAGTEYLQR